MDGRTDTRTDRQRENSIPTTNKVCGGGGGGGGGGGSKNQTIIFTKIFEKKCLRSLRPKCLYTYEKFDKYFDSVVFFQLEQKIHS